MKFILGNILYYIGDGLSKLPWYPYGIYNWCMKYSSELAPSIWNTWFDGREVGKNYALGYMCGVDFQHELAMASGGNVIYADPDDCAECRKCTSECGIVEVRIYFNKWIKPQNFDFGDEDETPESNS